MVNIPVILVEGQRLALSLSSGSIVSFYTVKPQAIVSVKNISIYFLQKQVPVSETWHDNI